MIIIISEISERNIITGQFSCFALIVLDKPVDDAEKKQHQTEDDRERSTNIADFVCAVCCVNS